MDEIAQEIYKKLHLDLTAEEAEKLTEQLENELHARTTDRIVDGLDDEQIEQLGNFKGSDEELAAWLDENVSDYDEIVEKEADILLHQMVQKFTDDI